MILQIPYLNQYFHSAPKQSLAQSMCIGSYQETYLSIHRKSGNKQNRQATLTSDSLINILPDTNSQ